MKECPVCDSPKIRRIDKEQRVCLNCYSIFNVKELIKNKK